MEQSSKQTTREDADFRMKFGSMEGAPPLALALVDRQQNNVAACEKQQQHNLVENQKKKNDGGSGGKRNKDEVTATVTVVMKVHFHCQGCETSIFRCARKYRGVEAVKVEADKNKLTVIGKVDPVKLHKKMEKSTKKKIELLSPQPKKDDSKQEKNNKNENKPKEPPVTAAFFKISLHCDGCCERIRHIITKTKGVHTVEMDRQKDVVTVRGAVDPKVVQARLKKKMKRSAEILPAKKDKADEQCNGGGNHQQQQQQKKCNNNNSSSSGQGGAEVNKMMEALMDYYGPIYGHIPSSGYVVEHLHAPSIFSDDNVNACSIM
uniref:HMA domain-containing protein n=1 Tax=Kalanchoe fedtschenkoi TaxID=63787 RepID=A0A7N0U7M1_KALFE